ncbi:alpha/beta-hydrolase family protein [Rhodobacter sp. SY28-1]|uniref:alpha/beta hydrolase n=1 Tax=Rhodobacter sp. SY28-1 TaxID=2562317 RepID=UPI0010BFDAB3|nr:alpha/beta-hydrolase family protein [Rhodobacter sp. SY28-1]
MFQRVSVGGLAAGAVLACLSLTPSMVPRQPELQGVLSGVVFAFGYGVWSLLRGMLDWLWDGRPAWPVSPWIPRAALAASVIGSIWCLWRSVVWQNSIRSVWNLPDVDSVAPFTVAGIAAAVFLILLMVARVFAGLSRRWSRKSTRYLPPRLANLVGLAIAFALLAALVDGVLFRSVLRGADRSAQIADSLIPPDVMPPEDPSKTGSAASLVSWEDLGRWGRNFVTSGPGEAEIAAFWNAPARPPIRVYVGLNAAPTAEDRAALALAELERVGGFDREVLVVAMPTGSGWLDPGAMDTLDYITRGDVATVAVQYSYLPSPVSVAVDPTHGIAEAQALFDLVYRRWTAMPKDRRPRLYLHGLSLGAFLSQETMPLLDVLGDMPNGALWAGSPFLSDFWRMVVDRRQSGSPAWRPEFGNGSLIRADNQAASFATAAADWGPMRLVFLQYGSDPIVFFDWSLAWRRPDWLGASRAPDVSPMMQWVPVVTMLQVGVDMAVAVGTLGYGHDYAARHYIPAWAATLAPEGWDAETEKRLIEHLSDLQPR